MPSPSPNLRRRMNNTGNITPVHKDLLPGLHSKYPEDYLDIDTYNSLMTNKPWIEPAERLARQQLLLSKVVAGGDKILVICVDFSDKNASVPISAINNRLFGTTGNTLRNYYAEVSNGIYVPDGIIIGWYRAPQTYAYYRDGSGCDMGMGTYPNNTHKLFEDVLDIINNDPSVTIATLSELDIDGDGHLNRVIIVHAGGEASNGYCSEIWAHASGISQKTIKGKIFNWFAMSAEYIDSSSDIQRCGIDCHELGHILGLPDLYFGIGTSAIGLWSLMDYGEWGTDHAITPTHLDVWSKNMLGWAVVHTNEIGTISIGNIENYHIAYMYTTSNPGEYFMIENRQQVGFDQHIPGNGLLIWHINERESQSSNASCRKVSLMQADNQRDLEINANNGDADDPYPGGTNNRSFNSTSRPNSLLCDGTNSYFEISNISDSATTMSMTISNATGTDITRGNVRILSTPPGARIWIDSTDRMVYTPAEIKNIPLWPHTYKLKLEGYRDFTGNFTLTVGGATTEIFATLIMSTPNTGSTSFTSIPFRTKIWMDSVDTGLYTPNTIQELANGSHTFRLVLAGYQDAIGIFTSSSGSTTIIPTMTLVRNASNTGNVYLTSVPSGATIQIDGINQSGYTPKLMVDIPFGNYTYTLILNGYQDVIGTFSIIPGRATEEISKILVQFVEIAYFTSVPSGAKIWIDNVDTGLNTPGAISAPVNVNHTFRLTLTGYQDTIGTFSLTPGHSYTIPTVNLVEIDNSRMRMFGLIFDFGILALLKKLYDDDKKQRLETSSQKQLSKFEKLWYRQT